MPSTVHSTILPSTRMLCTEPGYPGGPRIPRLVTSDVDDVTERHEVVSVYPHTELLFQMAADARRCSTLHKANCNHDLANREFPIHTSVSATIHAPEQTSNFSLVRAGLLKKLDKHLSPSSAVEVCPAHVHQHQNQMLSPRSGLSYLIGELINCCANQQTAAKNDHLLDVCTLARPVDCGRMVWFSFLC